MKENLFTRNDTILGVCEGLGEDFGFNPLWLRLAFIAPLFWFPLEMVMLYVGLGLAVLASRMIFPKPQADAGTGVAVLEDAQPREEKVLAKAA